jgi:hypothetical protein
MTASHHTRTTMRLVRLAAAALCTAACGCSHFDIRKPIPWGAGADGEFKAPVKVVAIWQDTVMTQAGAAAVRGFGGRLMFYPPGGEKPIQVRGSLTVYAFEEDGRELTDVVPDRKFVLSADEFEKHYSSSLLGHSYSVWIPWDTAGGEQKSISLLARFTPEDGGGVVMSEQATQVLQGPLPPAELARRAAKIRADQPSALQQAFVAEGVRPASYEAPLSAIDEQRAPARPRSDRMLTETINVPTNSAARRGAPASQVTAAAASPAAAAPVPQAVTAAPAPAPAAALQPPARFVRGRSRPLGAPLAPLGRDRGRWTRAPATPPSGPGPQP